MDKIKIGISACLLGEKVRYDGKHKHDLFITNTLGNYFEWIPICPEHDCGMPVPREPMNLYGQIENPRLQTTETNIDKTDQLCSWAKSRLEELKQENIGGFILKEKSPSCGISGIPLYHEDGTSDHKTSGLFAKMLTERFPLLPVIDEVDLHVPALREYFIERVYTFSKSLAFKRAAKPYRK